jgi:hypothetical protein
MIVNVGPQFLNTQFNTHEVMKQPHNQISLHVFVNRAKWIEGV